MKVNTHEWLWIAGLVSLLTSVGCGTEKTDQKVSEAPVSPVAIALAPDTNKPAVQDSKPSSEQKGVSKSGYFVANENIQTVYFDLSKSQLSKDSEEALKKNADWLKQNPPMLVQIAGYADSRGSLKRNQTLAERRANRVRDFYVAQGIPKERLTIVSLGTEEPVCATVSEDCLSKSRRVETTIESKSLVSR